MNLYKIKEQIKIYKDNRELAKRSGNVGTIAFCNGAIHELHKILRGEYGKWV